MRGGGSRRALQAAVCAGALVPILAGLDGVLSGAAMTGLTLPGSAAASALDSHVRYLSGLLLGIGLAFAATVPRIERRGARFRLLTGLVVAGGLGRLLGVALHGAPPPPMLGGLAMELVVTPLLCVWQHRVARAAAGSDAVLGADAARA